MAFRLNKGDRTIEDNVSITGSVINCYDTIGDDTFDMCRDYDLHNRSALELVRDQLSAAQRDELDRIDAFWRANAAAFNADFAVLHTHADRENELAGFVEDEKGQVPAIPASHWWWRPIEEEQS